MVDDYPIVSDVPEHLRRITFVDSDELDSLLDQNERLRQAVREANDYFDRNGVPCDAVPVVDRIADCQMAGDLDPKDNQER